MNALNSSHQKEAQLTKYKLSEMESICYQLRQDLSSITYLSGEIDRLTMVVRERDNELH